MSSVRTTKVDWTGDNPFIYMKKDPAGDWTSLSTYFRIAASDYGRGEAIIVLENPYGKEAGPAVRKCLTNNLDLAKYLVKDFVRHFGLFRPAQEALDQLEYVVDATFTTEANYPHKQVCTAHSAATNTSLSLVWHDLGKPFAVVLTPEESQTGKHEMLAVFQTAESAQVLVNGTAIEGQPIERDFLNGRAQSAALANSESWVRAQ